MRAQPTDRCDVHPPSPTQESASNTSRTSPRGCCMPAGAITSASKRGNELALHRRRCKARDNAHCSKARANRYHSHQPLSMLPHICQQKKQNDCIDQLTRSATFHHKRIKVRVQPDETTTRAQRLARCQPARWVMCSYRSSRAEKDSCRLVVDGARLVRAHTAQRAAARRAPRRAIRPRSVLGRPHSPRASLSPNLRRCCGTCVLLTKTLTVSDVRARVTGERPCARATRIRPTCAHTHTRTHAPPPSLARSSSTCAKLSSHHSDAASNIVPLEKASA